MFHEREMTSQDDPEWLATVTVNSMDIRPSTVVTRSMTNRNGWSESPKSKLSYYESEESDTDENPMRVIKKRRHSVGLNLQRVNNSDTKTSTSVNEHNIVKTEAHNKQKCSSSKIIKSDIKNYSKGDKRAKRVVGIINLKPKMTSGSDSKMSSKNNSEKSCDKKPSTTENILVCAKEDFDSFERIHQKFLNGEDLLCVKQVSFENDSEETVTNRRKSNFCGVKSGSAALPSVSNKLKTHTSEKILKKSLTVNIEKLQMFSKESEKNTDLNLDDKVLSQSRTSTDTERCTTMERENISSGETAGEEINVDIRGTIVRSEYGVVYVDLPTVEDQMKVMFSDPLQFENAINDLMEFLSTSRENLEAAHIKYLMSDGAEGQGLDRVIILMSCKRRPEDRYIVPENTFRMYKERTNNYRRYDECLAPMAVNPVYITPSTISLFHRKVAQRILRNLSNESPESKRRYYESKESDTDEMLMKIIKKRRHLI